MQSLNQGSGTHGQRATCVKAARVIIEIPLIIAETTVVCGTRALFSSHCDKWRHFCLLVQPPSSFFIKMWPVYRFELETPALNSVKLRYESETVKM